MIRTRVVVLASVPAQISCMSQSCVTQRNEVEGVELDSNPSLRLRLAKCNPDRMRLARHNFA